VVIAVIGINLNMNSSDNDDTIDDTINITFNPLFPWMLIVFGVAFICLGVLFMMPFVARQNVVLGMGIVIAAVIGIMGGRFWLRHLPIMMQLTPEGLYVSRKKTTYRWSDIERVDVKTISLKGEVHYLCIRLKAESREQYRRKSDGLIALTIKALGDFDLVFNDQEFSMPADLLKTEIEKRISQVDLRK